MSGNHSTNSPSPGVAEALVAAVLFGLSTPLAKGMVSAINAQLLAGLLYLGSGIGLGAFSVLSRTIGSRQGRPSTEAALGWSDAPWLTGAILAGGVIAPVSLLIGLRHTTASGTSLLLNLEGVFTALLAWFVFRENFDQRIMLGMLAIVAGGAVLSWNGQLRFQGFVGPLLIAGACLAWGIDNNLTQKVSANDPLQTTAIKGFAAGTVNLIVALALGSTWPPASRVAGAMLLGLVSYGLSVVFYVRALRGLGTARTGAYFAVSPFVAAGISLVIWREPLTPGLVGAGVLMAVGVWLHVTERHDHEHAHETLTHEHAHVHDTHHQHAHGPDDPPETDPAPHRHRHRHEGLVHSHHHYPDIHHRHQH